MRKYLIIGLLLLSAATAMAQPRQQQQQENKGFLIKKRQLPSQYIDQVTNLFSQHRWARGKELLDEGLELYPGEAALHYLAGRYWWNGKNYDQARYHLVKACQIEYHYVDAKQLLVNVEEITGNYSSAICYVNELLEVNPYWKGLWLRKIDLYKKLGNFEEANILLQRLSQIYPNDMSINGDYLDVLETTYEQARRNGDASAQEEALREIVRLNPTDVDYQLAYANVLIRRGRMNDALDNLKAAVNANPGNVPLVRKATDVLMETGQTMGALALLRSQMSQYPSPAFTQLYQSLLAETARMEDEADPYALFSRVYGTSGSMESLDYLLKQAVRRGYDEDALYYIAEMRKKTGNTPHLVMLEYEVLRRMGRKEPAIQVLEAGAQEFPDSYDINLTLSRYKLSDAADHMAAEQYAAAIPLLEFVRERCEDEDLRHLAMRRLSTCYRETNQPDKAEQVLYQRLRFDPEYMVTVEFAALRNKEGRTQEALDALVASYQETRDSLSKAKLANAYVELAYPYIRSKMESGTFTGVKEICDQMLKMEPDNYWAMRYAINASRYPEKYVEMGMKAYPEDIFFPIKKAQIMADNGQYLEALKLLGPMLDRYPEDEDLNKAYAGIADRYAMSKYKERDYETAAAYLDTAVMLRPKDDPLRYDRGLVFERQRQWDSAYVYQRSYLPSLLEQAEFKARMDALRGHTLRNTIDMGVDLYRFTDRYNLMAIATLGYSHLWGNNELQFRLNYTGRDADYDSEKEMYLSLGGRGVQAQLGLAHTFGHSWTVQGSAAYGSAYFPRWNADLSATWHLPYDWDVEQGLFFRQFQDQEIMYGVNLIGSHSWEHIYAALKLTGGGLHNIFYFNGLARLRFYPYDGGRSYLEAQAGGGTAPEVTFLNYYYTSSIYSQLNTFVAFTVNWSITYNFSVQLSGSWNTLYDQRTSVQFRNLLMLHVSAAISF